VRVVVVRHGCAGEKRRWNGDDADRPLDAAGERQSAALAAVLDEAGLGLRRLLTSPTRRCRDTLIPLGRRLGLPIADDPGLATGGDDVTLVRAIARPSALGAALSTHGELMQPLLAGLRDEGVPVIADRDDDEWLLAKGTAWVLDLAADGSVAALRHLAPVPALPCTVHDPSGAPEPASPP
jgi:phosphohistidine phosphatase SixA